MSDADIPFPPFDPGSVWLVGAGPGEPGLLTVLAREALRRADVVVCDALVDPRILDLVPEGTAREYAGKRRGVPSPRQPEITARLIALAREGRRVLRLKGGDPFLFGRGAEEALGLAEAGVPFRVVPGITAGIGGLGWAGIPATAKAAGSAVAFVTGHDPGGGLPDTVDWDALARAAPVIVVYMPLGQIEAVSARLMAAGRSADEAAALVSRATSPDQSVRITTLGEAARVAAEVEPPALFVVGPVVELRARLIGGHPAPAGA